MAGPHTEPSGARRLIVGLDFSGAIDAGRKIWIARGSAHGDALDVSACLPAAALPGSAVARQQCLPALRGYLASLGAAAVGCDFPFSLPRALVPEQRWQEFVLAFASRYPTAEAFRQAWRAATGGREPRRACDRDARTPFSPGNVRIYRQTHAGIVELLAPLVREGRVRVLPMQPPAADLPLLIEVCPASALKRLGLYRPYKGRDDALASMRSRIMTALEEAGDLRVASAVREVALRDTEGDALDSVIAALVTFRVLRDPGFHACSYGDPIEGYGYA
jgi:hypothetical protein